MESRVFRWACLVLATAAVAAILWMLNDMRLEVKRTNETVGERLPQILDNVKAGTDTLARVSKDIDAMRDLLGIADGVKERSLMVYADSILDFLEKQPGQIGLTKTIGSGYKELIPAADWSRDARKEGLWLTFRAKTKAELLDRLAKTKFGSDWWFVPTTGEASKISDLLKNHHPESKGL
ncbi:MAG: hypothetical protein ABI867_30855 [Kofleriaceae bacterium]